MNDFRLIYKYANALFQNVPILNRDLSKVFCSYQI